MGTDWPTPDGTAVRDYVHVRDVAEAHVAALRWLIEAKSSRIPLAFNIGSGRGTSLRELKAAFDEATGGHVPVIEVPRRPGDVAGGYARVDRAADLIGWRPGSPCWTGSGTRWPGTSPGPGALSQRAEARSTSATRSCCPGVIPGKIGSDRMRSAAASVTGKSPAR